MALALQIITFLIIVVLGFISFKFFPLKVTARNLTLAAMLVVLSVALQFFSLMIPLFGFPSLRIDFLQLPLMIIGVILGPSWAFISGIVQDILGLIITPTGFPFFGFMLNKVLMGLIPAYLFLAVKRIDNKGLHRFVLMMLGLFMIGSLMYTWNTNEIVFESSVLEITTTIKITLSIIILALMTGLIIFIQVASDKHKQSPVPIAFWTLSVLSMEVVVSLLLTPTWLYAMYNIPVMLSFLVRVVKAAIMIPLLMLVGYTLLTLLVKIKVVNIFKTHQ